MHAAILPWVTSSATTSQTGTSALLHTALQWWWLPCTVVMSYLLWQRKTVLSQWWREGRAGWRKLWIDIQEEKQRKPWWKILLKILGYLLLTAVALVLLLVCGLLILIANSDSSNCNCQCQSTPRCNCGDTGGSGCNCNTGSGSCCN